MNFVQNIKDSSFVNKLLLPGGGTYYHPQKQMQGYNLLWLQGKSSHRNFPCLWIPRKSNGVMIYSHGNGGTLKDWCALLRYYSTRFDVSVLGVEFPGYGPAEGYPTESSVNENVFTAFDFLLKIGYVPKNVILMGYSIGVGPSVQLAAQLCSEKTPPGALVCVAGFTSVRDIVQDLKGMHVINFLGPIVLMERWDCAKFVQDIVCPAMFIHGKQDALIPWKHSETLYNLCASTEKLLHICELADHCRFREPVDTVDPIATFLRIFFKPVMTGPIEVSSLSFVCPQAMIDKDKQRTEDLKRQAEAKKCKIVICIVFIAPFYHLFINYFLLCSKQLQEEIFSRQKQKQQLWC